MVFSFFVIMDLSLCGFFFNWPWVIFIQHYFTLFLTTIHILRFVNLFFLLCGLLDDVCVNSAWPKKLSSQWFLFLKLNSSLRKFYGRHQDPVNCYGICVKWQWKRVVCRNHNPVLSSRLILWFETRITRRVPHVGKELLTLPENGL